MSKTLYFLLVFVLLSVIAYMFFCVFEKQAECEARGGVLVKSALAGWECVQPVRIYK